MNGILPAHTLSLLADLVQIRRLALEKADENLGFRRHLKAHHCPDSAFYAAAAQAEHDICCTDCANCCRQLRAAVTASEIARLAAFLGLSVGQTAARYVEPDPADREPVLRHVAGACVFLEDNRCRVYEARPGACRDFPYFHSHSNTLGGRMASIFRHAWLCPIIFNAVEDYKRRLGYHGHRH